MTPSPDLTVLTVLNDDPSRDGFFGRHPHIHRVVRCWGFTVMAWKAVAPPLHHMMLDCFVELLVSDENSVCVNNRPNRNTLYIPYLMKPAFAGCSFPEESRDVFANELSWKTLFCQIHYFQRQFSTELCLEGAIHFYLHSLQTKFIFLKGEKVWNFDRYALEVLSTKWRRNSPVL